MQCTVALGLSEIEVRDTTQVVDENLARLGVEVSADQQVSEAIDDLRGGGVRPEPRSSAGTSIACARGASDRVTSYAKLARANMVVEAIQPAPPLLQPCGPGGS